MSDDSDGDARNGMDADGTHGDHVLLMLSADLGRGEKWIFFVWRL